MWVIWMDLLDLYRGSKGARKVDFLIFYEENFMIGNLDYSGLFFRSHFIQGYLMSASPYKATKSNRKQVKNNEFLNKELGLQNLNHVSWRFYHPRI